MKMQSVIWKICLVFFVVVGFGFAEEPQELIALRNRFEASPDKNTDAARVRYIHSLIDLEKKCLDVYESSGKRQGGNEVTAVNLEIARRPAPKDYNPSPSLLVGDWKGSRHGTRYFSDGKWIMLPEDDCTTHGNWKIIKNEYFKNYSDWGDKFDAGSSIYLLAHNYFVFGDLKGVYILKRIPYGTYGKR